MDPGQHPRVLDSVPRDSLTWQPLFQEEEALLKKKKILRVENIKKLGDREVIPWNHWKQYSVEITSD